jgi:hypothetical protein
MEREGKVAFMMPWRRKGEKREEGEEGREGGSYTFGLL